MSKFKGWESQLDSNGQPILPKQVICVTNKFSDIESDPYWVDQETGFIVGELYDILPYPYKLPPHEVKAAKANSGLLFMTDPKPQIQRMIDKGVPKMNFYISKKYFLPV